MSCKRLEALEPYEPRYTVGDLSVERGHFSPLGNAIVAEHFITQLKDWDLVELPTLQQATRVERCCYSSRLTRSGSPALVHPLENRR